MPGTLAVRDLLVADDEHQQQAANIIEQTSDEPHLTFKIVAAGGDVAMPKHLSDFVTHVINTVAQGATLQVRSMPEEVSTTVAADHLGVSRPTLMKMIREGEIPAHLVGTHHRIRWADLEDREARRDVARRNAAHQLRDLGRKLGD